ncbi:type I inositol polyphosphate 5-phosphatase 5 [Primulina huaijiensis]|uniref:type I inositol polyphosphate 5-phosphatase 5 n=1 Tax=Primulina huaijiensis TaxID=1492673 RepID=UPI003CC727E3
MATATCSCSSNPTTTPENSVKCDKKKKSIIPKIFGSKRDSREGSEEDIVPSDGNETDLDTKIITSRKKTFLETSSSARQGFQGRHGAGIEGLNLSCYDDLTMEEPTVIQDIRVFAATWNVGGKTPNPELNLEDFLQLEGSSDIYVLGFQEIVPLSPGNVLVIEDNEPASKWLALISHALNKQYHESAYSSDSSTNSIHSNYTKTESKSNLFSKPSLKALNKNLRADNNFVKRCNCSWDPTVSNRRRATKLSDPACASEPNVPDPNVDDFLSTAESCMLKKFKYQVVASKQMVGLFVSIWARKQLLKDIGHVRISCVGRGIMGYLGNKGCISISMTLHQTSFCFVCSHLASGEKEGDELRRNADVAEIMKSTQFSRICKSPIGRMPQRIIGHDRMIWLGDLNYRVGLSYEETRLLLEDNDWDSLLEKDQLNTERESGRVFSGWNEGKISFAPTYKYSHNSDSYTGETVKSKKKRRTPAWCDRILWRGSGIEQLSYVRGESRFSDHRPVCAVFAVEVETKINRNSISKLLRKGYSCTATNLEYEDCIPQRHSFYEL